MISAASSHGEFRFILHDGLVSAEVFREFLKRLMDGAKHPVFLAVDGHQIHKSRLVKEFVETLNGQFKFFTPPFYLPQLNPDKQRWAYGKRQVLQQLVLLKNQMKRLAFGALRRIQKLPELVKSSPFHQSEC